MKISRLFSAVGFTCLVALQTAHATIATFSDRATFLAMTGANDATGPLPSVAIGFTTTLTVGSVTFVAPRWGMGDATVILQGNEIVDK
ncbi:MAG: hypothetical protein OEM00_06450 [Burkholderiaceae bacterium]|nr:hypothetical protein [Burkholderiaceae bacterium]